MPSLVLGYGGESQHLIFPSDIQHILFNMQFRKHILVNCFMSSDVRRTISRATWLLWLTGIQLVQAPERV